MVSNSTPSPTGSDVQTTPSEANKERSIERPIIQPVHPVSHSDSSETSSYSQQVCVNCTVPEMENSDQRSTIRTLFSGCITRNVAENDSVSNKQTAFIKCPVGNLTFKDTKGRREASVLAEYLMHPQNQRLASEIEAELILWPDASVFSNPSLPLAAKKPRFVVTSLNATIRHLEEFIMQRIAMENNNARLDEHRLKFCGVSADLPLDEVLVVRETGEGQFTAVNINESKTKSDQQNSVFTISSPFTGLLLLK
ncbi:hypothetical protein AB6A40_009017, partial [Gnathostoma spinigerum]